MARHRKILLGLLVIGAIRKYRQLLKQKPPEEDSAMVDRVANLASVDWEEQEDGSKKKKKRAILDSKFHEAFTRLIKIAMRDWKSCFKLLGFTIALFTRTQITMKMSSLLGTVTRNMIERNKTAFQTSVAKLIVLALPASVVNSLLNYLASNIATDMSENLVSHLHKRYLTGITAYQVLRLSSQVSDVDQRITQDVEEWASSAVLIFQNLVKPGIDVILYSHALTTTVGLQGPLVMLGYFILSSIALRFMSPGFGTLTARLQKLMGFYRFLHMRFAAKTEEIAFNYGSKFERDTIESAHKSHDIHRRFVQRQSFLMSVLDNYIIKYGATVVGFAFVLSKIAFEDNDKSLGRGGSEAGHLTEKFVRSSRMLTTLSDAIGRIVLSYKQISILAGFTERVDKLVECLESFGDSFEDSPAHKERRGGSNGGIRDNAVVTFKNVQVKVPGTSDALLRDLTGKIVRGQHTLIAGPNGCGKTCLLRVIRGLWSAAGGSLQKPLLHPGNTPAAGRVGMMYLPQLPYMPIGTLVDCVMYPDCTYNPNALPLDQIIRMSDLSKVVEREGLVLTKQWDDILSGGESQKVAMARVYYHRPYFAVLDEATSMVSASLEPRLYSQLADLGITAISIAHRVAVWRYHSHVLHYSPHEDGNGGFVAKLKKLTKEVRLKLEQGYDLDVQIDEKGLLKTPDGVRPRSIPTSPQITREGEEGGVMKRAWSFQDLREVPRQVLRQAYIGQDWKQLLRRNPEAPSSLLTPTSGILNIPGTAASMLDVDQQGNEL